MEEELIKRILPHSDDAERSVIGCMMMNREAIMIASEILNGDEFYRQQMGIVFDSMVDGSISFTDTPPFVMIASLYPLKPVTVNSSSFKQDRKRSLSSFVIS